MLWEVRDARSGRILVKEMAVNGRKQNQTFFSYRVIQKWNLPPANLKMVKSLHSFKNRYDERIMKADWLGNGVERNPFGLEIVSITCRYN